MTGAGGSSDEVRPLLSSNEESGKTVNKLPRSPDASAHRSPSERVIVDFESSSDPARPVNWPLSKKIWTTLLYGVTSFWVSWSSSISSTGEDEVAAEFNTSPVIASIGTTMIVVGLGLGPFCFAPLSEVYGRRIAIFPAYAASIAFTFWSATSRGLATLMITRFLTGAFSSAAITCCAGAFSDLFASVERGVVLQFYGLIVLGGPPLAQIAGGAVIYGGLGWRWNLHITGIMMAISLALDLYFIGETFEPNLLVSKAQRLRRESGNWALHAIVHEESGVSLEEIVNTYLITPWKLLATPIMILMGTYSAFVYGLLYLTLGALPIVFEERRGWNKIVGKLPFLSLFLGLLTGAGINILNNFRYARKFHENNDTAVPEARLPPMMLGSVLFAGGLFWFGWTSAPEYHWILPVLACYFIGTSFLILFLSALTHLIDTFQTYAASAVATQTILGTILAGSFPVLASPMFHAMGTEWASTLLGSIAVIMIPIPYFFFFYGEKIRNSGSGKYMRQLADV